MKDKEISLRTMAVVLVMCVGTAICGTYVVCENRYDAQREEYMSQEATYAKLAEMQKITDAYFVGDYDTDTLMDGVAAGFVVGLGDRWSYYLPKADYQDYLIKSEGEMVGIGVSATYDTDTESIYILDVYDNSPAEKAGLVPGDRITAVDGETVAQAGYAQSVDAVRGDAGTEVTVTIENAKGKSKNVTITRKQTRANIVRGSLLEDNIGYIKISSFDQTSDTQFEDTVKALKKDGAEALILDVRNNPGGSAACVANMLDLLVPEGKIITLANKDGSDEIVLESDAREEDLPMAVLVNSNSYSAAEFFAADLQEYGKAVVVGEKTVGKGYAQSPFELSDGSALVLSNKKYYTAKGENLAGVGITPDEEVTLSEEKMARFYLLEQDEDDQLQKAIEVVTEAE